MSPERWKLIEAVYHQALERKLSERARYLAEACAGDADLRGEVESLLAQDPSKVGTLDRPAWEHSAGQSVADSTAIVLTPGMQLGPYRIEGQLGKGGMGEVFRATDTRLGRAVAIKTSHEQFNERFEREARAISALNHPHICTLYDVGASPSGMGYLVMELVEGESLAARLKRGKLSISDTLKYGQQIADALAAAHAKGIVHRDLKPHNIMLAKSGVKVLDFGLAKSAEDATLTASRAVMGTPAYMAPEQFEGKDADARTDIYALGLVLYEMATGKRAIRGEMPRMETLPLQVAHIIDRCLAHDSEDRWQSGTDVRSELEWAGKSKLVPQQTAPSRGLWKYIAVASACAAVAAISFAWFVPRAARAPANPLADAQFTRFTDFDGPETDAAISRDGRFVAFRSDRDGPVDTWLSQVGTGRFINMTHGTQTSVLVDNLGFTPDGSELWLAGIIGGARLRLMPLSGGSPRAFLSEHAMNVAWSPDGARLVYQVYDEGDPLFVSDSTGANAKQIYIAGPASHNHFPVWSTDGEWIYFVHGTWDSREMDIWRIRPVGGQPEQLTTIGTDVKYLAPIDSSTVLFSAPGPDGAGPWLWALDTVTKQTHRASYGLERYTSVEASGDGRRLVATVSNPTANLWTAPLSDHLVHEADVKAFPLPSGRAFAPRYGGKSLFYLSTRGGGDGLWRYQDDQSIEIWRGVDGALQEPAAPSPDGRRLAIILRKQGHRTLHTVSSEGGDLRKLSDTIDITSAVAWSPDGNWIAASGIDAQGPGLFKIPASGGASVRMGKGPSSSPVWSPDGSMIAYLNPIAARIGHVQFVQAGDGQAIDAPVLQVRIGGERFRFVAGERRLIYMQDTNSAKQTLWMYDPATKRTRQLSDFDMSGTRTFDVTPDGKRIVFDRLRENSDIVLIDLPKKAN